MDRLTLVAVALLAPWAGTPVRAADPDPAAARERLSAELEDLHRALHIPGLSVAVVQDQKLVWARGYGFADLEDRVPATEHTTYRIASLTKTFASTLALRLVEQGKLDLDAPMSRFSPDFKDDSVRVRHVLSHTSKGSPGERYEYDGNRFATLTPVLVKAAGRPFRAQLVEGVIDPVGMAETVPGQDVLKEDLPKDAAVRARYEAALKRLAKPYTLYGEGEQILSPYPYRPLTASAGLISTVTDLAKYDAALDRHALVKAETQRLAWAPAKNGRGEALPYGLGWFVQVHKGETLVWHYGQWPTFSALYLKVPGRKLTFLALANSTGLSAPFRLGAGDVLTSPFALAFLRAFAGAEKAPPPAPPWRLGAAEFAKQLAALENPVGYRYDREVKAHAAVREYVEGRRARARKEVPADPKKLADYPGKYALSPDQAVEVSVAEGRLVGGLSGQEPMPLFAEAEDRFFAKLTDAQLTFVRGEDGRVTHLVLRLSGRDYKAARSK